MLEYSCSYKLPPLAHVKVCVRYSRIIASVASRVILTLLFIVLHLYSFSKPSLRVMVE